MKKMWRRVLVMTLLLMAVLSVNAFADGKGRLYSQRTVQFPNSIGGWSNQFTLARTSVVTIDVELLDNNNTILINNGMNFFLTNMANKAVTKLSVPATRVNAMSYSLQVSMPAGTYQFGFYSNSSQTFRLRFSLYVAGGINAQDSVEVMVGKTASVDVKAADGSSTLIPVVQAYSENPLIATVSRSNTSTSIKVTITGVAIGTTNVHLTGDDGSTDTIKVKVVKYVPTPVMTYKSLTMNGGEKIKNTVTNASGTVTWSSTNTKVAKVSKKGKITAVGYGKCNIYANAKSEDGKNYRLVCKVNVTRTLPDFTARITKIYSDRKRIRVKITNVSKVPMTVTNSSAKAILLSTGATARKLKLKGASSVTIAAGKSRKITFQTTKGKLSSDPTLYEVRFLFQEDKLKYYGSATSILEDSKYRAKKSGSVWVPSFSTDGKG